MKTLLLIPPPLDPDENVVRDVLYGCWCKGKRIGGAKVPPLVILSVATVLKQDNKDITLLDAPEENINLTKLKEIIKDYNNLIILTSSMTFNEDIQIIEQLKQSNPKLLTILFGAHPTFMPEHSLSPKCIDIVVRKEPEFIIRDIIRNTKNYKKVKGIAYKENNKVIINEDYPFINNLDDLPIPDRSLLTKGAVYYNPVIRKYPYTTSETSRGCPGKCTFCTAPKVYGGKLRAWSAQKVIKEIVYLLKQGYKEIYYRDETFTTFKKRNIEICEQIINKKLKFNWICNVRANTVDKETLLLMKKAGCHTIKVGVESGVQEILNKSNKGTTVQQTRNVFKWAKQAKINTHAHMMIGMPGETEETLKTTLKFIKELNPNSIDVGVCTPYPGTDLFKELTKTLPELEKDYTIKLEELHTTAKFNKYFTKLDEKTLQSYLNKFYKEFYLRPKHAIKNILQIRNKHDLKRVINASFSLLNFIKNKK